ncbi:MAG: type II toxin-antitoxin system VapC family toxin [Gemmatimonadota bacterium]|nr:type II toxin-antitoxin system VapC family toxin [Gemmatimonadota bacterium]
MAAVLVDSSVLLDILTEDAKWYDWSANALRTEADKSVLVINPIIYAEVSVRFELIEELDEAFPSDLFRRDPLPWESAFLAGKAFLTYRRRKGAKQSPLPDFYIGAHAAISRLALLTRDPRRYRTYFPTVELISPG